MPTARAVPGKAATPSIHRHSSEKSLKWEFTTTASNGRAARVLSTLFSRCAALKSLVGHSVGSETHRGRRRRIQRR
jgi:hypothetical protein